VFKEQKDKADKLSGDVTMTKVKCPEGKISAINDRPDTAEKHRMNVIETFQMK
jgi:hypothetical protein